MAFLHVVVVIIALEMGVRGTAFVLLAAACLWKAFKTPVGHSVARAAKNQFLRTRDEMAASERHSDVLARTATAAPPAVSVPCKHNIQPTSFFAALGSARCTWLPCVFCHGRAHRTLPCAPYGLGSVGDLD